jgi:hypothetical protein
MKVSAGKLPNSRLALVAATISAAFLLLTAACAQGETVGDGVTPLAVPAESTADAAPAEQAPAPVPPAEAAEAPVEAQGSESAIESAGAAVESVAAAPSRVAAAYEPVGGAASEAAREAAGALSNSATTDTATTVVAATGDRAPKLLGGVGQVTEKAATAAGDQARQLYPPRTERLPQPAGMPPSGMLASPGESPFAVSPAFRGKTPSGNAGGGGALAAGYRGFAGAGHSWLGALEGLDGIHSAPTSGMAGTPPDDRAPLDGPMPAPGSSGVAAGSTGSFFVPLAALLALLALVAPAAMRRFGEVPDFRPPTPFVCALERPG